MKKKFDLTFCFKGNRNYVHGTDIFIKILEHFTNAHDIDIAFHDIAIKNMDFSTEKPKNKKIQVTFKCLKSEEKIKIFATENNTNILCRYKYYEDKIINNSTINLEKENIILNKQTKYSFIEHIVAMNKTLHETLYSNVNGKWYFTRLRLEKDINMSDILSLELVLKSNFQFKLTKSAIIVNKVTVGFIYFSLIPKES